MLEFESITDRSEGIPSYPLSYHRSSLYVLKTALVHATYSGSVTFWLG